MKQYNLFKAIPYSLFSSSLYKDVGRNWRGRGFAYLLLLLTLCWLVVAITSISATSDFIHLVNKHLIPQMPVMTFKDGVLSVKQTTPIKLKVNDQTVVIIDSKNKITNYKNMPAVLLVQKNAFVVKDNQSIKHYLYSKKLNGVYTKEDLNKMIINLKKWILLSVFIFVYFIGLLMSYAYRVIQSLLYGLIGKIFAALFRKHLSYGATVNLALIAMTPAILLKLIFVSFGIFFAFNWIIYILVTLGYLLFAVKSAD